MFDIGWQELLLIGVIALVVIGPKDMPVAMRTAARMFSKLRALSREFQNTVSDVVREAELDELRRKLQQAGRVNVKDELTNLVDPDGRLRADLQGDEFDFEDDLHHEPPRSHAATVPPPARPAPAAAGTAMAGSRPAAPAEAVPPPSSPPPGTVPSATPAAAASAPPSASVSRQE